MRHLDSLSIAFPRQELTMRQNLKAKAKNAEKASSFWSTS